LESEYTVWEGRPSQITNLPAFIICTLLAVAVIPVFIGFWKWLQVRCMKYELTSQRLRLSVGVLSRRIDELELYRVKDSRFEQPFGLRIFGLGNIILQTSDPSDPVLELRAVRDGQGVREKLRAHVEALRSSKRVIEVD
jgi:uncharacterized membrane protein YdbT with pleckstrin-like domain